MKADLSRVTFDSLSGFARVLQQQGRPVLDADWNEQNSILLHRLHTLGRDLIGPFGGPSEDCGFEIDGFEGGPLDFTIGAGRYYVNGILVENPQMTTFRNQPVPVHAPELTQGKSYLVFLDIWEDLVTTADEPGLMEPALGGIETALRTRIAWQVRTHEIESKIDTDHVFHNWASFIESWQPKHRGMLRARITPDGDAGAHDPGHRGATAHYRGLENQLYRVEIHHGGKAGGGADGATFKWSRENGSVAFRLRDIKENSLLLDRLDATGSAALTPGDWLEEVAEGSGHWDTPRGPLLKVLGRGPGRDQVTVEGAIDLDLSRRGGVWLRRWEQRAPRTNKGDTGMRDGTLSVVEGTGPAGWIALENGIEVQFEPGATYRPGDYWIVPARAADGGMLLWPQNGDAPVPVPPHGNGHGYAPLAIVEFKPIAERRVSCRRQFKGLASSII